MTLIKTLALIVTLSLISGSVQSTGFDDPHQTPAVYSPDGVFMLGGGSQKSNNYNHKWLENDLKDQRRIPVDGLIHGLLITKPKFSQTNGEWNIQRVHRGKLFSWMSNRSLALDANGKPHIAYGQTHLYYARYDEEWTIETVDDSWDVGMYASLAVDSDGYPHISYYDRDPNGHLKYAYKDENGWHIETADGGEGSVGVYTSLVLDSNDQPHISYGDLTNRNLKYAHWDGSRWNLQLVDSDGDVAIWSTSLTIDPNNLPHISYFDWTNGNLKYAYWDGGDWQIVTVDNDDDVGGYSSLAINENGYPHISYLDYANGRLKYAFWNGSEWQRETVDEGGSSDVGWYNSIALDADGHPHIGYCDWSGKNLKYAFFNGSNWVVQRVTPDHFLHPAPGFDTESSEGYFASLVLDDNGRPHISHVGIKHWFWFGSRFGLRHTYYDGSEWQRDVVDYELEFSHTSLAVDNTNNPHIGYIRSEGAMGYARWDGSQWHFERIRISGNIVRHEGGSGSFLALDADQRPHMIIQERRSVISSGMLDYPSLIYTWYDGSTWQENVLYRNSWNARRDISSSSISLDEIDRPHICFYGLSDGRSYTAPSSYVFRYMVRENNEWVWSNIETSRGAGEDHSFVIDNDGLPQVSYRGDSGLIYARPWGSDWDIHFISDEGGSYNSIKTDTNDLPHISFMHYDPQQDNTALKYAHWNGNEWHIGIVDSIGRVGFFTSLDLDKNDFPHISYFDDTNYNLKYAYWDGNNWQIETVDSYRTVGLYTSLALDANGNPHISYFDASFGDLKYATKGEATFVKTNEELPNRFTLYQNYPNPFNPATTIRYHLPERCNVMLRVYNTLGQEVIRLIDEEIAAGTHKVVFDASALPSGVYIYRLQAGDYVESRKMLYLK